MIFSYYLKKIPYTLLWQLTDLFKNHRSIAIYCADLIDWYILKFIKENNDDVKVVSKNHRIRKQLREIGIEATNGWVFPQVVIMTRHAFHIFPCRKIIKIGLRHGPYHFKSMIDAKKYNLFDLYLFTSEYELQQAEKLGIKCGAAGGYPKLDPALDGSLKQDKINLLRKKLNFDARPILIFSATWEGSGLSAVERWYNQIEKLTQNYNILVTLHPWVKRKYRKRIDETKGVILLEEEDILPYLVLADLMVGDTSSILAEFSALKKAIITFRIKPQKRLDQEVFDLICQISLQIDDFKQLPDAIEYLLKNQKQLQIAQEESNRRFFLPFDGDHRGNCLKLIKGYLKSRSIAWRNWQADQK